MIPFGTSERITQMWRKLKKEILEEARKEEDNRLHSIIRGGKVIARQISGTLPLATIPNPLDVQAKVGVRVNGGATTYIRRRLNLIGNFSMADDGANEEVDITYTPSVVPHAILSGHTDTEVADTPASGDVLSYATGLWRALPPAAVLRVREVDSAPNILPVGELVVPNGSLVDLTGGAVQLTLGDMDNPMTTLGDLINGGSAGLPTRLAIGDEGDLLAVSGGVPVWLPQPAPLSHWEPLMDGDVVSPEFIFADGDVIMVEVFP